MDKPYGLVFEGSHLVLVEPYFLGWHIGLDTAPFLRVFDQIVTVVQALEFIVGIGRCLGHQAGKVVRIVQGHVERHIASVGAAHEMHPMRVNLGMAGHIVTNDLHEGLSIAGMARPWPIQPVSLIHPIGRRLHRQDIGALKLGLVGSRKNLLNLWPTKGGHLIA